MPRSRDVPVTAQTRRQAPSSTGVVRIGSHVDAALPWLLVLYGAASLVHFAHNAEFLDRYPNLPISWSRADIYAAWCCVTAVGVLGFAFHRRERRRTGLSLLAVYAGLGFAGLLHYARAPVSHHTVAMNLTIWIELAAATALLIDVAWLARRMVAPP